MYKIFFLVFFSFVISSVVSAEDSSQATPEIVESESGVEELVSRLKNIQTISGEFVQYSVDQRGTRVQESQGSFKAKRPGMFYWYTSQPLEQAIYSDGKNITIYDPDLEQATIQKLDENIQSTPAILFSGDVNQIGEQFEVERRKWDDIVTQYLLTPKSQEVLFERMLIRFDGKQITEMRLSDSLGQDSTIGFIHTSINERFDDAVFTPELPEGTDIIRDLPQVGVVE